jgi:SAM-dependent methyltransferase
MGMLNPPPLGVDVSTPNVARIYDYMLGGKDNFAVDREAAGHLLEVAPDIRSIVRDNRSFIGRVVRYLAEQAGVRQFLDLGGGLPTQANVHEMAQRIAPEARVAYVDNDPVVWSHGQALLADGDRVVMALADLRHPEEVLGHPAITGLLDLSQPVAVLCVCVLHFVPDDDEPHRIIAEYRDRLAPGSHLVITHGTFGTPEEDPAGVADGVTSVYRNASAQLHVRSHAEIKRFFDGWELVDPGVVWMNEWRLELGAPPVGQLKSLRAGVGRKP